MIVSVSRRTDIPAFYSDWFMDRIRAGFALVQNPFNPEQVSRVDLSPEAVDALVFLTRNPGPLLSHLDELEQRGYRFCFQITVTGYPGVLEPFVKPQDETVRLFRALSNRIGPDRVIWRFDPIVLSTLTPEDYVIGKFGEIAGLLRNRTRRVIISFADYYVKVKRNFRRIEEKTGNRFFDFHQDTEGLFRIASALSELAGKNGMAIFSCAEKQELSPAGIAKGKCIDAGYLSRIFGIDIPSARARNQRRECGCDDSRDIGRYDTCLHGCAYCYATRDVQSALRNRSRHDPQSPCLIGNGRAADVAPPKSGQLALFEQI